MENEKALIVLIAIIAVGFLVIFNEKIIPYFRERKERKQNKEIRELVKNSVRRMN